ncbi:4-(cytidine 5'-diphospho)-2-C-methyl-D-erythritol kinase [Patescibacteria group bacterium]|nr:4-(cytidine 5'-diphospho)-2-C-methyl-D-erythritol kinase [Patescibacteria group bacterium]
MKSILIQANAKINLNFKILGKRPDGYHNIESTFQSIDLADFISIEKAKDYFSGGIICPESENIILKAKNLLEKTVNKELPCQIHLQKVIPISAGLGGGSADAAATLIGLNLLYNLNLNKRELAKIGIKIGADVPFFLYGGTCEVGGRGEIIKSIKIKVPKIFVLFRPHKRIKTKMMYGLYDKTGKDFLAICENICPEIKKLKKYFGKFGLELHLSGSGPTVFCQVNDYQLVKKIAKGYSQFNGDIFICHPQKEAIKIL